MSIRENKSLVFLIALNLISLMVISWLVILLMSAEDRKASQDVLREGRLIEEAERPAESIEDTIEQVVSQHKDDSGLDEKTTKLEFYDDGSILRMEETDISGNTHVYISNSLQGRGRKSATDEDYIAALQELKKRTRHHAHAEKMTEEDVQNYEARQIPNQQAVNYFNKVLVDAPQPTSDEKFTLVQQIEREIADDEADSGPEQSEDAQDNLGNYKASLDAASVERANETRTIKVKPGDTLWKIAIRAYGDGNQYTRIYKANPQIKNPNKIVVGQTLRVPL